MTGARPRVALALTPQAERAIEAALFDPETPLLLVASAAEAGELPEITRDDHPDAVLISPDLAGLGASHVTRARATGTRIIGLALHDSDRPFLESLGVDTIIDTPTSAAELAAAIDDHHDTEPTAPSVARHHEPSPNGKPARGESGSVVAVLGSKGAPGASELAASVAAVAAVRWNTVLVECDAAGGGLAVRLGTDPHHGSLLALVRAAHGDARGRQELIDRWLISPEGWPAVLPGPPDPASSIDELTRPGVIDAAINALATCHTLVVCDTGHAIGAPDHAGPATRVHREAVTRADAVLVVAGAREEQIAYALQQLDLLLDDLAVPPDRLRVLANGAGGPGAMPGRALREALIARLSERGLAVDVWIPWDARALARATRRGLPLVIARPRGPYAKAIRRLVDELFLPDAPAPRRTKRRLPTRVRARDDHQEEVALPWRS